MSAEPRVSDWAAMNVGAAARDALALIGEELAAEQYKTDQLAFARLNAGHLTSDEAIGFWHKKNALYTLQVRLTQKARQGVSAAKHIAESTDG